MDILRPHCTLSESIFNRKTSSASISARPRLFLMPYLANTDGKGHLHPVPSKNIRNYRLAYARQSSSGDKLVLQDECLEVCSPWLNGCIALWAPTEVRIVNRIRRIITNSPGHLRKARSVSRCCDAGSIKHQHRPNEDICGYVCAPTCGVSARATKSVAL